MYKRILVALDGSELSESVLPYARFFASTLKIPVELLHVIDPVTLISTTVEQRRYHDAIMGARERNNDYLKKVAVSFSDALTVDCTVEVGKPEEVIVDRAAADTGTLIAIATHGRSGIKRWLLGSVANKILQAAANHLLIVRSSGEIQKTETVSLKRVVVPLDGSRLAEMVIPHAVELARKMDLEIVLARVFALPIPVYASGEYTPNLDEIWEQIKKESQDYLEEKVRQLQGQGLVKVSTVSVEGIAADKIIDVARERAENFVAMCTHGRSGIGRWVLGSVTDRVVCYSGGPVLVIRAPIAKMKKE